MTDIILTQYSGKIVGPVARLIGYIMNSLYMFLNDVFSVQNIALCIILFTVIIYFLLLPLTYKQQKFSRLQQEMQPEVNAIREKYKNKKDPESVQKMNEETQLVYQKYGVSTTGSCVQLLINFPIMLAMWQVIRNIPAYVGSVKDIFTPLVDKIMGTDGYQDIMASFLKEANLNTIKLNYENSTTTANSIIDVLYALSSNGWDTLKESFSGLGDVIRSTEASISHLNNLFGLNIANSPMNLIATGWGNKDFLLIFVAFLIPLLSYGSQVLNIKLMTSTNAKNSNGEQNALEKQMKTMNTMMPLLSLFMVFSLPVGLGIYWITGSVVRSIQQVVLNRHMKDLDLEAIIEKNKEKAEKKKEKQGIYANQIANAARLSTRNIEPVSTSEKETQIKKWNECAQNARKCSLLEKANLVRDFNERNNRQ